MVCIMPGFPVLRRLPELTKTHVHQVGDSMQPSLPWSSLSPPAFNLALQHWRGEWGRTGRFPTMAWSPDDLFFPFFHVAERVLQRDHRLQGSELKLVPHYDVLEPEKLTEDTGGGSCPGDRGPGAPRHILQEAGGPAREQHYAGDVTLGSEEAPGQSGASLSTGPQWDSSSLAPAGPVSSGPWGSSEEEGLGSPRTVGSPDPVEIAVRSSEPIAQLLPSKMQKDGGT